MSESRESSGRSRSGGVGVQALACRDSLKAELQRAAAAIVIFSAIAGLAADAPALERFEFTEAHMAVDFRMVFYAADAATAKEAAAAALARIKQLDEMMSDYKADRKLRRLSDT